MNVIIEEMRAFNAETYVKDILQKVDEVEVCLLFFSSIKLSILPVIPIDGDHLGEKIPSLDRTSDDRGIVRIASRRLYRQAGGLCEWRGEQGDCREEEDLLSGLLSQKEELLTNLSFCEEC